MPWIQDPVQKRSHITWLPIVHATGPRIRSPWKPVTSHLTEPVYRRYTVAQMRLCSPVRDWVRVVHPYRSNEDRRKKKRRSLTATLRSFFVPTFSSFFHPSAMLLSISASVFYPRFTFLLRFPLLISLLASPVSFFLTGTPLSLISFFLFLRLFSYLACCVIFFLSLLRSFSEFVLPGLCFRIILFFSLSLSLSLSLRYGRRATSL